MNIVCLHPVGILVLYELHNLSQTITISNAFPYNS